MADQPKGNDQERQIVSSPRISVVREKNIKIEFRIEELVGHLLNQATPGIIVASCSGCRGCSA